MARRKDFDYPHTCPVINGNINDCKESIRSVLADLIANIDTDRTSEELSKEWADVLMEEIYPYFETVRETNEDMRRAAEQQIKDNIDEIISLKEELSTTVEYYNSIYNEQERKKR